MKEFVCSEVPYYICIPLVLKGYAQVAKLVDALCSGRSACKGVMVRIHSWALTKILEKRIKIYPFFYFNLIIADTLFSDVVV